MDALIEAFGSYSIGSVIVLVAAFVFLYKIYRKAAQAIVEQHDTKKSAGRKDPEDFGSRIEVSGMAQTVDRHTRKTYGPVR